MLLQIGPSKELYHYDWKQDLSDNSFVSKGCELLMHILHKIRENWEKVHTLSLVVMIGSYFAHFSTSNLEQAVAVLHECKRI